MYGETKTPRISFHGDSRCCFFDDQDLHFLAASIYNVVLSGDVAGFLTGDEQNYVGQLIGSTGASHKRVLGHGIVAAGHVDASRGNTVDRDSFVGNQFCQCTGAEGEIRIVVINDRIGIQLVNITIQDAEPPTTEVSAAFKEVETAKQGKETALNNANKYQNEKIPAAEASVDQIIQKAEAEKANRIKEAEGQVARFNALYQEYIKFPDITKQRMFYEAMEEILPTLEVIIDSGDGSVQKLLPLGTFSNTIVNEGGTDDEEK